MAATLAQRQQVHEETTKWVWPHPLSFEDFLDLYMGRDEVVELLDGMVVEHMAAQFEHESLIAWLLRALGGYVEERDLGLVLGSRTALQITEYRGRIPDILFIQKARLGIIQPRACYGPPDLVVEVLSPNDRPSDRISLEADYKQIGVAEIMFIDPAHKRVYVASNRNGDYEEAVVEEGELTFDAVDGFRIDLAWLFTNNRPGAHALVTRLLEGSTQRSGSANDTQEG